jgi:TatA/E family protein of Tat protein translocase
MDFLGIGPLELLLILLILFIVVGPDKLPGIARAIGRGIRKFKEATKELSQDFKEMSEEAKDTKKEMSNALKPQTALTSDFKEIAKEIEKVTKEASTALDTMPEEKLDAQKGKGE